MAYEATGGLIVNYTVPTQTPQPTPSTSTSTSTGTSTPWWLVLAVLAALALIGYEENRR